MHEPALLTASRGESGTVCVRVAGSWKLRRGLPSAEQTIAALGADARRVVFDAGTLGTFSREIAAAVRAEHAPGDEWRTRLAPGVSSSPAGAAGSSLWASPSRSIAAASPSRTCACTPRHRRRRRSPRSSPGSGSRSSCATCRSSGRRCSSGGSSWKRRAWHSTGWRTAS